MNDTIQIKGGTGNVPALHDRELGYRKDEKALYIGTEDANGKKENIKLCDAGQYSREVTQDQRIKALEDKPEPSGMFYAVYGETTGEEINAAYVAGKCVACKLSDGKVLYLVADANTGDKFTFSYTDHLKVITVDISGNQCLDITTQEFATREYIEGLVEQISERLATLNTRLDEINARLEALENPSDEE